MVMPVRTLSVWCNQRLVGQLLEQNNLWSFQYDPAWQGFDLNPALPRQAERIVDGASLRPVQWFFDNLLPEEGARTLLAKDARIVESDAFGLLAHFGAESAGALTLLAPNESPAQRGRSPLGHSELSQRIRRLPDIPLSQGGSKRMSLAGAQHKLPVIFEQGALSEPGVGEPSTHILKPNHSKPEDYWHTVVNEYFVMRLAAACGLPVPEVDILRVPEPVYLVKRFDRHREGEELFRDHAIDACQLLSLDRAYKYTQSRPEILPRIVAHCRLPAATRQALFRWLIFNLLIGNTDNHLKNLSFLMTDDGIRLAPHYDLLSTAVYEKDNRWLDAPLSWAFGDYRTLGSVDAGYLQALAEPLKISARMIKATVSKLCVDMAQAADQLLQLQQRQVYDGVTKEGELRLLRQIQFGVLRDMSQVLQQSV